jgi:hypothetical protein
MSNFEKLGQQQAPQMGQPQQMGQLLQQIKANPAQMLQQRGLNIPAGMNDPNQIINHLIQSGQVPQNRLTQIMQIMGRR